MPLPDHGAEFEPERGPRTNESGGRKWGTPANRGHRVRAFFSSGAATSTSSPARSGRPHLSGPPPIEPGGRSLQPSSRGPPSRSRSVRGPAISRQTKERNSGHVQSPIPGLHQSAPHLDFGKTGDANPGGAGVHRRSARPGWQPASPGTHRPSRTTCSGRARTPPGWGSGSRGEGHYRRNGWWRPALSWPVAVEDGPGQGAGMGAPAGVGGSREGGHASHRLQHKQGGSLEACRVLERLRGGTSGRTTFPFLVLPWPPTFLRLPLLGLLSPR